MRGHLSGLCQPTYMLDIPGGHGKAPIGPDFIGQDDDQWIIEDYQGKRHAYRDERTDKK